MGVEIPPYRPVTKTLYMDHQRLTEMGPISKPECGHNRVPYQHVAPFGGHWVVLDLRETHNLKHRPGDMLTRGFAAKHLFFPLHLSTASNNQRDSNYKYHPSSGSASNRVAVQLEEDMQSNIRHMQNQMNSCEGRCPGPGRQSYIEQYIHPVSSRQVAVANLRTKAASVNMFNIEELL